MKIKSAVFVILLAASAIGLAPSSASAEFKLETTPEIEAFKVSANETLKIAPKAGGAKFECTTLVYQSSAHEFTSFEKLALQMKAENCGTLLGEPVTVTLNRCDLVLHLPAAQTTGTTDFNCISTPGIELIVGKICKYEIDTQTGLNSFSVTNLGAGTTRELEINPTIAGITVKRTTSDVIFCPPGSNEGTYSGKFRLTAWNNEAAAHIGFFSD